jgi:hypothetical protein
VGGVLERDRTWKVPEFIFGIERLE